MKTRSKDRNAIRNTTMTIPMSSEEKQAITEAARTRGLTMSSFVRMLAIEAAKEESNRQ